MNIFLIIFAFVLILLDRISKYYIVLYLKPGLNIKLLPGFLNLKYVENSGAAFGILNDQKIFLAFLTLISFLIIFGLFRLSKSIRSSNKIKYCLVFIFSGGVSNFYDRIFQGYVVDFFDFAFVDFPVFNLADIFLTLGCIILFLVFISKRY